MTSGFTGDKEKTFIDFNIQTRLQQLDLDSDDDSEENLEPDTNINISDDDREEDPEEKKDLIHFDESHSFQTNVISASSITSKGKEKSYIDLNLQTRLQQLNIDSDECSLKHHADHKDRLADISYSDNYSREDSDEELKEFNKSPFAKILDEFMTSDKQVIDLDTKIEKNVRKTLNYFQRKFIMDAMAEECEILMEKLPPFIYKNAGCIPENYTDYVKTFSTEISVSEDALKESITKFKEQISIVNDTGMNKLNEVVNENNTESVSNNIDNVKGETYNNMNNVNKNNTIFFSKPLINTVFWSCGECDEEQIFDNVLLELLKLKEICRKYFAISHSLCTNDVDLLDEIYYYYSGNLHWLGTEATNIKDYQMNIVWNLNLLNILLSKARTNSSNFSKETLYYLDSLINFNCFQITLYANLALSRRQFLSLNQGNDKKETQIRALIDIVLNTLKIYQYYVNKKEIKEIHIKVPLYMRDTLDDNALYFNHIDSLVRELYFKRIDLNVCLILLDNLNLLEERLLMPDDFYKKVKSSLYHFIYHLNEDWNTFMPDKSEKVFIDCTIDSGQSEEVIYKLDLIKLSISPLIYLERKELYNCLNKFKDKLELIDIKPNIRTKSNKASKDAHTLDITPYVTDEISLKKILYYMKGLSYVDLKKDTRNGQLIIFRIIQILGELIKNSEESAHLSTETAFFLQTKIPLHTLKLLKDIRNNITHVDAAQLVAKIDVEQNENNDELFSDVLTDLKEIKRRILDFFEIHKLRAKKASIKDALNLLRNRLNIISKCKDESQYNVHETEENGYFKQIWRQNVSSKHLLEEVKFLEGNIELLIANLKETTEKLRHLTLKKLPVFIKKIRDALPCFDNSDKDNADTDEVEQWGIIQEILRFIVKDANMFEYHPWEVKRSKCSSLFDVILKLTSNKDRVDYVNSIISMIIESAEMYGSDEISSYETISSNSETKTHPGLIKLNKMLKRTNFLTLREQKALLNKISKITESCKKLKENIMKNEPIAKKEHDTLLKNITLKNQSESQLSNLILGKKRSLVLLECLSDRVSLLKEVLNTYSDDVNKQHLKFLNDQKYRLIIEALILDIMNIFNDTNQKNSLRKTSKFLAEVNLRNVLSHGNPLLELAGDVIDAKDLPVELMTRAMRYARDEDAIKALTILIRQNVDPNDIRTGGATLSKDQQNLIREFNKSQHCEEYFSLALKDFNEVNSKSVNVNNKEDNLSNQKSKTNNSSKYAKKLKDSETTTDNELLKAVKAGNLEEVKRLVKTLANTNARDASGKGCLHYAAMKGRADIIEVLVRESVDARCDKDGRSALHYAAMNRHAAAARALLAAGADVTATDRRGNTPRNYATNDVMRSLLGGDIDVDRKLETQLENVNDIIL